MTVDVEPDASGSTSPRDETIIEPALLAELERSFKGDIVLPTSPGYDARRSVWNGSIDRRPAAILRCVDAADVTAAIAFGRRAGLPLAVRGGGHSFPGLSVVDDGVVIDLRPMAGVRVDNERGLVRAQGGVLLGELDRRTQEVGMAVPIGAVSHTGLAGLTLGGGIGWLMRRLGLAIDQLAAVDLVTADGSRVHASEAENAELFWGVRGGGGNFGVVTDFVFRLNPVGPTVLSGLALWPMDEAERVARFYRDWIAEAPDELTTALVLRRAPAVDTLPSDLHGLPVIGVVGCWAGDVGAGERFLKPMRAHGSPLVDAFEPRPLVEHQSLLDASYPHGLWAYIQACDVAALSDVVIDVTVAHARDIASSRSTVTIWHLGGAVARAGADETAFGSRSSGHVFNITGATDSAIGFEHERLWAKSLWQALAPHHVGVYANFLMTEGDARVRQAYGEARYDRLRALKRTFDPENVFRLNQNIVPA